MFDHFLAALELTCLKGSNNTSTFHNFADLEKDKSYQSGTPRPQKPPRKRPNGALSIAPVNKSRRARPDETRGPVAVRKKETQHNWYVAQLP